MDVLHPAKEEIAFSGLEGCTWQELKYYLSLRGLQVELDEAVERYLWRQLAGDADIYLYVLPSARTEFVLMGREIRLDEEMDPFPLQCHSVEDGDVRGSCRDYHQRQDVTASVRARRLSLEDAQKEFGAVVLVGSQGLRAHQLVPPTAEAGQLYSDPAYYSVLEAVGVFRGYGALRPQLSRCFLGHSDARRLWHIVAQLAGMGLVVVKEVVVKRSVTRPQLSSQHRVFHVSHASSQDVHTLEPAPHAHSEEGEEEHGLHGNSGPTVGSPAPLLLEQPLSSEIYFWIHSRGSNGATSLELSTLGPPITRNMRKRFLKFCPSQPAFTMATADATNTKTIRLFSAAALNRRINQDPEQEALIQEMLKDRSVKRRQILLEMFASSPTGIFTSDQRLKQAIADAELKEGRTARVDKKTVWRLLLDMVEAGEAKTLTIDHTTHPGIGKNHTLYCRSSVSDEELQEHIDCMIRHRTKRMPPVKSSPANEEDPGAGQGAWPGPEAEHLTWDECYPKGLPEDIFLFPFVLQKFQKLEQLHMYLWVLSNGLHGNDNLTSDSLLVAQYPWLQLPLDTWPVAASKLALGEIIAEMPLVLVAMVIGLIKLKPSRMPPWVHRYLNAPEHRLVRFSGMPRAVQQSLTRLCKEFDRMSSALQKLCGQLQTMGLLRVELMQQQSMFTRRQLLQVEVATSGQFLDTSDGQSRRSFFLEEARLLYPRQRLQLSSAQAVHGFWAQLRDVCLATRIITAKPRRHSSDVVPSCVDAHALPYLEASQKGSIARIDKLGFGAGGLPPSFFSHSVRNWGELVKGEESVGGAIRVLSITKEMVAMRRGGRGQKRAQLKDSSGIPRSKKRAVRKQASAPALRRQVAQDSFVDIAASLEELYSNFEVLDPTPRVSPLLEAVRTVGDIECSLLLELFYGILLTRPSGHATPTVLHSFPEGSLLKVHCWMKEHGLLEPLRGKENRRHHLRKYNFSPRVRSTLVGSVPPVPSPNLSGVVDLAEPVHQLLPVAMANLISVCCGEGGETSMALRFPSHFVAGYESAAVSGVGVDVAGEGVELEEGGDGDSGDEALPDSEKKRDPYIPETALINPCQLSLGPAHRPPPLLEPRSRGLPPTGPDPAPSDDWLSGDVLPEEEYARVASTHFHHSPADCQAAVHLVGVVREAGPVGLLWTRALEVVSVSQASVPPNDILQLLLNFNILHRVGTTELRLVHSNHTEPWHRANRAIQPDQPGKQLRIWSDFSEHSKERMSDPGDGDGERMSAPGDGDGERMSAPGDGDGERMSAPGDGDGKRMSAPGDGDGERMSAPGDGDGERMSAPGDGDGERMSAPGDGDGERVDAPGDGSRALLADLKATLLRHFQKCPGVTWPALKKLYCQALQPASLEQLVQVLVQEGCVQSHRLVQGNACGLFSSPTYCVVMSSGQGEQCFDEQTYFECSINSDILSQDYSDMW